MIYKVNDGFVISAKGTWRPGLYADEATARYASRLDDALLQQVQDTKNGAAVELADLQKAKQS